MTSYLPTLYLPGDYAPVHGSPLPAQTKGPNDMTLLQQIRLWMRTRNRGELYHDSENDPIIERYYFDISPEAMLTTDEYLEDVTDEALDDGADEFPEDSANEIWEETGDDLPRAS
jgi:hypothetical protein